MPRVPIFDGVPTANLAPASSPQLQAPRSVPVPGDPGEGLQQAGQAMMGLGQQVARREQEEKAKLSTALAKSGYNQFRGAVDSEFNALKGLKLDAALHGKQKTADNIRKHYEKILNSMTDEDAKEAFSQAAEGLIVSAQSDIDNYARVQNEEFQSLTSKVNQEWMERDAVDAWVKEYEARSYDSQRLGPASPVTEEAQSTQDPQKIGPPVPPVSGEQFERAAIGNIEDEADRMGLPQDSPVRKEMIRESRARVNEQVVEKLAAAGRYSDAEKHLTASLSSGAFNEDKAARLIENIQKRRSDDAATMQIAQWDAEGVPMPSRVAAVRKAFTEDRTISAETYRSLMDGIGKAEKQRKEVEDVERGASIDFAESFFANNPLATTDDFKKHHPQVYESMQRAGDLPDLFLLQGKFLKTDYATYLDAMHGMTVDEVRSFSRQAWAARYAALLSPDDHAKVMARYDHVVGSKDGTDIIGREKRLLKGFSEVYKDRFPSLNIYNPESLKDEKIAKQYDRFLEQVQDRIGAYESTLDGRKINNEELQKILDGMKVERAQIKSASMFGNLFGGADVNINSLEPADRENVYIATPNGHSVYLKDVPLSEEKAITAELQYQADSWLKAMRNAGANVSYLDVPQKYRPTPSNVIQLWVSAGAPGAAEGSSGAKAAPEKIGPPSGPPIDISKLLPSIPEEEVLNMTNEQFADRVIDEAYKRQGIDKKVRNNFWWMNAGSTNEARRRAEEDIASIQATEDAVRERVRQHIYKKMNVPPGTVSDFWAPPASKVAADREVERVMAKGTGKAEVAIEYERLLSDAPARRAAMDEIRRTIDFHTPSLGKNHHFIQSLERQYQDLGLVDMKMKALKASFEVGGMDSQPVSTPPSQAQPYGPEEYRIPEDFYSQNVYGPYKDPLKRYEADASVLPDIKEDDRSAELKRWFESYRNKNGSGKERAK